jgi:tetratricopeptide (TPR) repeat protein
VKAKARETLVRAGDRAESLGAAGEAMRYLEQAAGLADDPRRRAALLDRAGWLALYTADYEAGARLLGESIAVYEAVGDTHAAARVSGRLAFVERYQGRFEDALARAERAFEVVSGDPPDEDLAFLASVVASGYVFSGDPRATERNELALELAESLGSAEVLTRGFSMKSILANGRGRPEEAVALLKHGLGIALEHELWDRANNLYFNLSDLMFQRDRYSDALGYLGEALEVARRRGSRPGEWSILAETTYPLYMSGRWDEAVAVFSELPHDRLRSATTLSLLTSVLEIYLNRGQLGEARRVLSLYAELEHTTEVQDRSGYLSAAAAVRRAEGRLEEALAAGVEAFELARPAFGVGSQSAEQGLVEAVEAALALGDRERADDLLATVEALPPGLRPPYLDAQAQRFRARLLGPSEAADAGYAAAASRFRELDIPFWLGVTLLEHGERLVEEGRADEAEPLLAEARAIFERLDAGPWLERLGRGEPAAVA